MMLNASLKNGWLGYFLHNVQYSADKVFGGKKNIENFPKNWEKTKSAGLKI